MFVRFRCRLVSDALNDIVDFFEFWLLSDAAFRVLAGLSLGTFATGIDVFQNLIEHSQAEFELEEENRSVLEPVLSAQSDSPDTPFPVPSCSVS